jgi:hypothetical protein
MRAQLSFGMRAGAGSRVAGGGLGNRQVACAYRDPGENTCRLVCLTASLSAIAVAVEQEEVPRRMLAARRGEAG